MSAQLPTDVDEFGVSRGLPDVSEGITALFTPTEWTYTQAQVERIFDDAAASAERNRATVDNWDAYMLGFVSARLGVTLDLPDRLTRLMDMAIEKLPADMTAAEALTQMRDMFRETSAEFTLDAAGA